MSDERQSESVVGRVWRSMARVIDPTKPMADLPPGGHLPTRAAAKESPKTRRPRPEDRATDAQREAVRVEMKAQVDSVVDAWAQIELQAKSMGRGYPSGGEGGGDGGSLVERVAVGVCRCEAGKKDPAKCSCSSSAPFDPATAASDWLSHLEEARGHLKNLDGSLRRVLPAKCARKPGEPSHPQDCQCAVKGGPARVNTVDLCTWCNDPAPKVKRLDGQPYCHPDLEKNCWRSAYDLKRRSA